MPHICLYRLWVYRPGVGEEPAEVTITVTLHDDETSVTAARSFAIEVPALTQKEIDDELALMEKVKANYFNGIRGGRGGVREKPSCERANGERTRPSKTLPPTCPPSRRSMRRTASWSGSGI